MFGINKIGILNIQGCKPLIADEKIMTINLMYYWTKKDYNYTKIVFEGIKKIKTKINCTSFINTFFNDIINCKYPIIKISHPDKCNTKIKDKDMEIQCK
jgi:hypothetical protein